MPIVRKNRSRYGLLSLFGLLAAVDLASSGMLRIDVEHADGTHYGFFYINTNKVQRLL